MASSDPSRLRRRLLLAMGVVAGGALHGGARAAEPQEVCLHVPLSQTCPTEGDALVRLQEQDPQSCPQAVVAVQDEPTDAGCCYEVTFDCGGDVVGCNFTGRPLLVDGKPLKAAARHVSGWTEARLAAPELEDLSPEQRRKLAQHWTRIGAAEYASVAGLSRFTMDLMANGAPHELIAGAQRAAADEIRHARMAFTLASAMVGAPVGPGAVAFPAVVPIHRTVKELALATVREGCTIETLSACLLQATLEGARDAAIVRVLRLIMRDEDRHAELAWSTLRWALSVEPEIGPAVQQAFVESTAELTVDEFAATSGLERYGMLSPEAARACRDETVASVIIPCAAALMRALAA